METGGCCYRFNSQTTPAVTANITTVVSMFFSIFFIRIPSLVV